MANPDDISGGVSGKHPPAAKRTLFLSPTSTGKEVNRIREDFVVEACWKLNDVRFQFGSSFILPQTRGEFLELLQLRKEHPGSPLSVFGHADPVNNDVFNKTLSGHRAESVYAVLTRDTAMWEKLFKGGGQAEGWGTGSIQRMLEALGFNPGPITGSMNPQTKAAVKDFQGKNDLNDDGDPGPKTREKLFTAYMIHLCPDKIEKSEFLGQGADAKGKGDFQGCGEFNPLMRFSAAEEKELSKPANKQKRDDENGINRRVMVLLFRKGQTADTGNWPCPRTVEGVEGCRKRFFGGGPDGDKNRSAQDTRREFAKGDNTFACRFYHRMTNDSPCEGIIPPPVPVLDGVQPIIFFKESPGAAETGVTRRVILVEKPHISADTDDIDVELTTDVPFDGVGTFTIEPAGRIDFFRGATKIQFNGTGNVFTGAELASKISLRAVALQGSDAIDDITLTLTLSGGSKKIGGPAKVRVTAVEVTLDLCEPRTSPTADPAPLPQPASNNPPASPPPKDKFFGGRCLIRQNTEKTIERALLIVRKIKPAAFQGNVVLTKASSRLTLFANETPQAGEVEIAERLVFPSSEIASAEKKFFVEGNTQSGASRDGVIRLGVEGLDEDADAVRITVIHAEIVSDVEEKDLKLVERVPEVPARVTDSTRFMPPPLIVGVNFDVRLRPHINPVPAISPLTFLWSTASGKIALTDTAKEIVKLKASSTSGALNDITIDLVVETDNGKFKLSHKLTSVTAPIQSVILGETPTTASPINFIRNPSVTPILSGGEDTDNAKNPIIEIGPITPALDFTLDDPRISWWIIGGEAAGSAKYDGRAAFLNNDASKHGLTAQITGRATGDVLVQPYSGGFGYGMFRTHVAPLHKLKYRVNRILTDAKGSTAAVIPTRSHDDAKRHIKLTNIYLRQIGIEMIPDDSTSIASRTGNDFVGLSKLDKKIVSVTMSEPGHFDVKINDLALTFQVGNGDGNDTIALNARNEVIVFAYIHSLSTGPKVLAQAQTVPPNHAPTPRTDPPGKTSNQLTDAGVPSTSLTTKTGLPGDTPAGSFTLKVIPKFRVDFKRSRRERHVDLLWGIAVPTTSMDNSAPAGAGTDGFWGLTLAHEVGHVLGLNHRISIASGDPFPDSLTFPGTANVMFPSNNFPTAENFDIIQAKAVRFSEVLFRNP